MSHGKAPSRATFRTNSPVCDKNCVKTGNRLQLYFNGWHNELGSCRFCSAARESKFTDLQVDIVKEVVTLGPKAQGLADSGIATARHVSPEEFHAMLKGAEVSS